MGKDWYVNALVLRPEGPSAHCCRVCVRGFNDRLTLLKHFINKSHRNEAKGQISALTRQPSEFWLHPDRIHSVVRVSTEYPTRFRILKHFDDMGLEVVNFMLVSIKPIEAVIQFKEPEQVSKLFYSRGARFASRLNLQIHNKVLKVCRAENSNIELWGNWFRLHFDYFDRTLTMRSRLLDPSVKYCATCQAGFVEGNDWLRHLLKRRHKKTAFAQFRKLNEPSRFRLSSSRTYRLVQVFSVSQSRIKILRHMFNLGLEVTNFISLSTKQTVAVVEFRDPDEVRKLFKIHGASASSHCLFGVKERKNHKEIVNVNRAEHSNDDTWRDWLIKYFDLGEKEKSGKRAAKPADSAEKQKGVKGADGKGGKLETKMTKAPDKSSALLNGDDPFKKDCALCNDSFNDEDKWLTHFFQPVHKKAAWAQFKELSRPSEFWTCPSRADSVVHVHSVSWSRFKILKHLSALDFDITNCISLSVKPTVSVIQFRDPAQVRKLFDKHEASSLSYCKLLVNNKAVDVYRAQNSCRSKWNAWFRKNFDSNEEKKSEATPNLAGPIEKENGESDVKGSTDEDNDKLESKMRSTSERPMRIPVNSFEKHCSICDSSFEDKEAWLVHFFKPSHKYAASVQYSELSRPSEYWLAPSRTKSLVHVTTNISVSKREMLQHLSTLGLDVTNFVSSPIKPTESVVQLQDRGQVRELFEMNSSSSYFKLLFDGDKGVDVYRAENSALGTWNAWFCKHFDCNEKEKKVATVNSAGQMQKRGKGASQLSDGKESKMTRSSEGCSTSLQPAHSQSFKKHCAICKDSFDLKDKEKWLFHFFQSGHKNAAWALLKESSPLSEFWLQSSRINSVVCVQNMSVSKMGVLRHLSTSGYEVVDIVSLFPKMHNVFVVQFSEPEQVGKLFGINGASSSHYLNLLVDGEGVDVYRAENSPPGIWKAWFRKHFDAKEEEKKGTTVSSAATIQKQDGEKDLKGSTDESGDRDKLESKMGTGSEKSSTSVEPEPAPPFQKHCALCDKNFVDETKWLKHFFKSSHKGAVWDKLSSLNQPSKYWLRPCRIFRVVHVSSDVASSLTVLRCLSSLGLDVSNCITLSRNPSVAVLQIRKANQVKQLFKKNGAKSSPILELSIRDDDGKLIQVGVSRAQCSKGDSWEKWLQDHFDQEVIVVDEGKKKRKRAQVITLDDSDIQIQPTTKRALLTKDN